MNICACVANKTPKGCIEAVKRLDAELIEHRMDFMEEIKDLERIYTASKLPVIATIRPSANGGAFLGLEESRIAYLFEAIDAGCTMIDIELETPTNLKEEIIEHAKENNSGVIISMHDFEGTADKETLQGIIRRERKEGADIGKIVTTPHSVEDCHRVINLILTAKRNDFPLVAFAMGDLGKFTRIIAPLYGAPFTYASSGNSTAPGQLSLRAMRRMRELIS
ncbi:MAG: type I 3-dehydroquinate dehydratase [Euryarchaeota archaeon]|nr:type I 3-dehydroquinate dehydratase [Euryarchaeota archaeon]